LTSILHVDFWIEFLHAGGKYTMTGQIAKLLSGLHNFMRRVGVGVVAGLTVCALAAPAYAQTTTYSEDFTFGVDNNAGDPQVDNWEDFRDGLTGTYSNITVGGSQGPNVSCSDPVAVAAITSALNTDATATIPCEGRDWNIGTCVGSNELSVDVPVCTCQAASDFTLRPDVDFGGSWGGIGGTCGTGAGGAATQNVSQMLTVSVEELGAAADADLSLDIVASTAAPAVGANTFIDVEVSNVGPATATGVIIDFALPSGLAFVSDDSGGAYNPVTGVWTVGTLPAVNDDRLRVIAQVLPTGSYTLESEVSAVNENDNDSTPGNASTNPGEDDSDTLTLFPVAPPPPLFCLGRPIQPLAFENPILEAGTGSTTAPNVGDTFRFGNVSPGFDALITLTDLSAGASISQIDNEDDGFASHLQPTLVTTGAGGGTATFEITIVTTGANIPADLDFAASGVDIDGAAGLLEFVEVSDNFVESALNSVSDITEDTGAVPVGFTRFISNDETIAGGTDPSGFPPPQDTEADFPVVDGISLAPPHIFTAFYTDVTTFTELNATVSSVIEEDFGDAPFDPATNPEYGNPIHVIDAADPLVQLGATNTAESESGNDTVLDAGDDGITIGPGAGTGFEGVTLQGLVESATITAAIANGTADNGLLQAFFDWNADGDFDDVGEQPIVDLSAAPADSTLTFTVTPPAGTVAGPSFARFRWATSSVGVQDPAGDGEVEDYRINLLAPEPSDLSLTINASNAEPGVSETITLIVGVTNEGPADASGVVASIPLPPGLVFVSSDGGAAFDETTGEWTLPAPLASGDSVTLNIQVSTVSIGTATVLAEILTADRPDTDSTPGNAGTTPGEDDTDSVDIMVVDNPVTCPAGFTLFNTGGTAAAVASETDIGNSNLALGALSPEGTTPPDGVSAFLDLGPTSVLVLDLGVIVPENARLLFSLARDGGAPGDNTQLEIRTSLDETNFPTRLRLYGLSGPTDLFSTAEDTLERFSVAVPAGGARFVRFDILNGDNAFVDGISFTQSCIADGELVGVKTVSVFDPLGEGLFALPGNDVTYTISVENNGASATDDDSIFLIDELPPELIFFNGDADGPGPGLDPVNFAELVATGLDPFVFADSVGFAGAGPAPADLDACDLVADPGFDPDIRYVCFNPKGIMDSGDPNPAFTLSFRARIR